ncbi:MAG: hypothetical protein HQK73_07145 [Desulfamplus sp.]|nr:hypothetical protein [Desulfamplus sp.]MBF0412293.1 hypothetical protein [Desulfamplus sp.]
MTTIPGAHTHVIQQSNLAHEATHHLKPVQPDPADLQNQQMMRENIEQTTVISTEKSSGVNIDTKTKKREEEKMLAKKKRAQNRTRKNDPDLPGNLLDTVA